ncbi:MAG TPA: DUF4082 domain-containing protein [Bryobacteraceae bacterium]|nr:DUF4082 domain-containing protein [Bryobacteraceae bacterium]
MLLSWAATAQRANAQDPNQGPGGPILAITSSSSTFGKYYAEILRTEGLNEFAVSDIALVTPTTLASYEVVILAGPMTLTPSQVTMFTNWVNAGGNFIAMRPNSQLDSLLGLTSTAATLSNAYMRVDTSTAVGAGIVSQSMQFHGTAAAYTLNGASSVATLYTNSTTATANPAVTLRSIGTNGGHAAAFAYDLATSIVYTRQGNPAWAAQERDGFTPIRSNDKFFGAATEDLQTDWVDLDTLVSIPQADEQQRLLSNLILQMNLAKKPLPRFWYFPRGKKAVVVMTGDDHGNGGTAGRFDQEIAASPAGCNVANWECIRSTSYMYVQPQNMTNAQVASYAAQGFEVGLHINTNCDDFTPVSLNAIYSQQIADFRASYPSITTLPTQRHHCLVWSDWASGAKIQLANGMRLDTNYYFWPPGWGQGRPGHFTGSAMPMRFADLDGTLIDVYNAPTQMTDESGQSYPLTGDVLLNAAVGPQGFYGVYTVNSHADTATNPVSDAVVPSALARGIPVVSSAQMLTWLDGRNNSSFSGLAWNGSTLTFSISPGNGANGLQAMVPRNSTSGVLNALTGPNGAVSFTLDIIKGVEYAFFSAGAGNYTATYGSDTTPPTVTSVSPASGATGVNQSTTVTATFSEAMDVTTITTTNVALRNGSVLIPATVAYNATTRVVTLTPSSPLAALSTFTATISTGVKDSSGNALAANRIWSFTTATPPSCPCTIWSTSTVPGNPAVNDPNAVELGVKFRTDLNGFITGVRFYKGATNTGIHVGTLWSSSGQVLRTATFINETASGWQQVNFSNPVAVTANTVYVASYHTTVGNYATDNGYFATAGVDNAPLHLLQNGVSAGNGVYAYSATAGNTFPSNTFQSSNYWVDVAFVITVGPTALNLSSTTPANNATGIALNSPVSATFNNALNTATITSSTFTLKNAGGTAIPGTYNVTGSTATLTPSSPFAASTTYTATLTTGVSDTNGTALTADYIWSFTTAGVDTTPPTVTSVTPANGATGVSQSTTVTATFSETMDATTITTTNVALRNGSALIPAIVAYNASTRVLTLTPSSPLASSTTFTATVSTGVKDSSGNALAANRIWSFTTASSGSSGGPEPTNWFSGDIHVHTNCGGSPEALNSILNRMAPQNLSVISLLADMGNGEVQNPATDLPLVNGQDASVSIPGRIVHWDTEWHWDAIYTQYAHQALGGHILALGLTQAQQVWEESTSKIFDWAHQRNAVAGFAHMQYLDGSIPQSLTCCTPIEYPVEVALGSADFISEDVDDSGSSFPMNPDQFIQAYYKLLNTGFRPGFAAGTDYPCNAGRDLGSLLTYVQVPSGQLTYQNWINGIKNGRTVVSRNGHREFLDLKVNGNSTPGDEIQLPATGSLPVTVQWTATQNFTGTIELVNNGVVVASQLASVTSGTPVTLTTTVNFPKSGWLAARRMGADGHQVHTAAVFVIVNNAPIRTSVADANYFIQWMDNLLTNTSPGGIWNSFFPTQLSAAQSRYQAAKAKFQQIAAEAAGATPLGVTATLPATGATAAAVGTTVTTTFSNALNISTVNASTFTLRDPANTLVTASYSASGNSAILSPAAPLLPSTTYTATLTTGVRDTAGNALVADYIWSFTTSGASGSGCTTNCTIWSSTTIPGTIDQGPDSPVELGVTFRSDVSGSITGIRFYKAATNIGTHVGNLWSSTGQLLGSSTFISETASGWQQVNFPTPIAITANTDYVASYHTGTGHYSQDENFFAAAGVDNPPLHALRNGVSGFNGLYAYGSGNVFPTQSFNSANYWVDVVFNSAATPTLTSIAVTPGNPTILVGGTQQFTATGTYSDNSTQSLTNQVTWSSTSTAVATINAAGLATSASAGSTSISARLGSVTGNTSLTVQGTALAITTTTLSGGTVGTAYTGTLAASGGTSPYTWSLVSGSSLPAGLTLNASTGGISGTPTPSGTSIFTVRVTDSATPPATTTKSLSITIAAAPTPVSITTTALPEGTVGVAYSTTLAASSGTAPLTWSIVTGSLPSGLTLNPGTGVIAGTPTTAAPSAFTVRVTDSATPVATAEKTLSIAIAAAPVPLSITTTALPGATVGTAYSMTLVANGGTTPYTWSLVSGTLPPGLTLNATTGSITGTPTSAVTRSLNIRVSDSATPAATANRTLSITIASALSITTATLPGGNVGAAYSTTIAASGGTAPRTWSVATGSLPAGLTLNASTGGIAGTPTAVGTSNFTIRVTDAATATANRNMSITIAPPIVITTTALPRGTVGTAYSMTLVANGGTTPYTWSLVSGTLPPGLTLNATTGSITGTPTSAVTRSLNIRVSDSATPAARANRTLSITIASALP